MAAGDRALTLSLWILISSFVFLEPLFAMAGHCELRVRNSNAIYSYSLASPAPKYPYGVQSEDGFYKIAVNETLLWFQLCDEMIFNHDPPTCLGCEDCGGPSRCGMKCSALVANKEGGYYVCKAIAYKSNLHISLLDAEHPEKGVVTKMSSIGHDHNCSLSVSIFCDPQEVQVPNSFQLLGKCNYATELRHPSGCAKVDSTDGKGLGWFATLIIIVLCLLGGYLLIGSVYRFFFLGIHGAEAIPNLQLWLSLPQRARNTILYWMARFRGWRLGYTPIP